MEEITVCFPCIHFTLVTALSAKSFVQWTTAVFLNVMMRQVRVTLDESHLCLPHHLHLPHHHLFVLLLTLAAGQRRRREVKA